MLYYKCYRITSARTSKENVSMAKTIVGTYDITNIGKNLLKLRTNLGLSRKEFASNMNVSVRTVYDWEDGFKLPKLINLIQIATLFQVSIECILL